MQLQTSSPGRWDAVLFLGGQGWSGLCKNGFAYDAINVLRNNNKKDIYLMQSCHSLRGAAGGVCSQEVGDKLSFDIFT